MKNFLSKYLHKQGVSTESLGLTTSPLKYKLAMEEIAEELTNLGQEVPEDITEEIGRLQVQADGGEVPEAQAPEVDAVQAADDAVDAFTESDENEAAQLAATADALESIEEFLSEGDTPILTPDESAAYDGAADAFNITDGDAGDLVDADGAAGAEDETAEELLASSESLGQDRAAIIAHVKQVRAVALEALADTTARLSAKLQLSLRGEAAKIPAIYQLANAIERGIERPLSKRVAKALEDFSEAAQDAVQADVTVGAGPIEELNTQALALGDAQVETPVEALAQDAAAADVAKDLRDSARAMESLIADVAQGQVVKALAAKAGIRQLYAFTRK